MSEEVKIVVSPLNFFKPILGLLLVSAFAWIKVMENQEYLMTINFQMAVVGLIAGIVLCFKRKSHIPLFASLLLGVVTIIIMPTIKAPIGAQAQAPLTQTDTQK